MVTPRVFVLVVLGTLIGLASGFVTYPANKPLCAASFTERSSSVRPLQADTGLQSEETSNTYKGLVRAAKRSMFGAAALLGTLGFGVGDASAFDAKGEKLFEVNCVGCHVGGGNIIGYARGKTLKQEALKKNKINTKDAIVHLLQEGKGIMPPYSSYTRKNGDIVPARMTDHEMGLVADYVLEQALSGWQ